MQFLNVRRVGGAMGFGLLVSVITACGGNNPPVLAAPLTTATAPPASGAAPAPVTPTTPPAVDPVTPPTTPPPPVVPTAKAFDDAVVIAVIDSNINPYHWDYLASKMPQAGTDEALPLDQDPASWLPGHPGAAAFKSYQALKLTIDPTDAKADTAALATKDDAEWSKIVYSEGTDNKDVSMYWIPNTKIIGHVAFSGASIGDPLTSAILGSQTGPVNTFATDSHGIGTSSVSTGAIHGACPHCLLVYVHGTSEQANEWVQKQDWIDLQTNSWGLALAYRDRAYAGSNTESQKAAVERGQQIFFSAGNGQENAFIVPNTTLQSSQEGPDWIVTVGATDSVDNSSPSGHGKPADISSVGDSYPSAYGNDGTASGEGVFSGTSNATPVIAGIYGEALYRIRKSWAGASRVQKDGVIATGPAGCKAANANCALADGKLTVHELREAMYRAATLSDTGYNVGGLGGITTIPFTESVPELELLAEGHGNFRGKMDGAETYQAELARIVGFVDGSWFAEQDLDQKDWMYAKSLCRQKVWGAWDHGQFNATATAPALSPLWPVRTWLMTNCATTVGALVAVEKAYAGLAR